MSETRKKVFQETIQGVNYTADCTTDQLKLFLSLETDREDLALQEITQVLISKGIAEKTLERGVLQDLLKGLKDENKSTEPRRIAKGKTPITGRDGKILYLVRKFGDPTEVAIGPNGRALYRERHLFENIEVGDLVARIYPPKPGTDGFDVFGRAIPSSWGQPYKPVLQQGLELKTVPNKDYTIIVSREAGYLKVSGEALLISNELTIPGDLDLKTGNLDFVGTITIKGDVFPGFRVRARGDIVIMGSVEDARIESEAGSIAIKNSFYGGDYGFAKSAKDVSAKIFQQAEAECGGVLFVTESSYHSTLRCLGGIEASRAQIIGGKTYTALGINASELGTAEGSDTEVILGNSVEVSANYSLLVTRIADHHKVLETIKLHLGPHKDSLRNEKGIPSLLLKKLKDLKEKYLMVQKSLEGLIMEQNKLLEAGTTAEVLSVNVEKCIHPGVVLRAGGGEQKFLEPERGAVTYEWKSEQASFVKLPYTPLNLTEGKNDSKR